MAKAISLRLTAFEQALERRIDVARTLIVLGCASALILAGQPIPL